MPWDILIVVKKKKKKSKKTIFLLPLYCCLLHAGLPPHLISFHTQLCLRDSTAQRMLFIGTVAFLRDNSMGRDLFMTIQNEKSNSVFRH